MTFLEGIFPSHLSIRMIAEFLFCFVKQPPLLRLRTSTFTWDSLTHSQGNFISWRKQLLPLDSIPAHPHSSKTRSVHTSVREAKQMKKKVSGSSAQTGFCTNHSDHLCISRFLPAQLQACRGPPDRESPQRALQVCFPARCLSRVSVPLSSVYISTGLIWRCREAITFSVVGFWYLCSYQLKAETSEVLAQPSCTDKGAASLCCWLGKGNLREVRAPACSAKPSSTKEMWFAVVIGLK